MERAMAFDRALAVDHGYVVAHDAGPMGGPHYPTGRED
jgi:hypothetical protein